ncbi:LA2681 family HEPN domain-containing protein [Thermodesulfobacteriota bacterium]
MNSDETDAKPFAEEDIARLSTDALIEKIGTLANPANDRKAREKFQEAIALSEAAKKRELSHLQLASLNYAVANAWGELHQLSISGEADVWNWEQEAVEKQLIHLRQAVNALENTGPEQQTEMACPIYTNLAATLYHIGRFVEAVEYWDKALTLMPSFSMARGNRGYALIHYAHALYDEAQALILLQHAYEDLKKALANGVEDHARPVFEDHFNDLKSVFPEGGQIETIDLNTFSSGKSEEEKTYRAWCISNRLFLNPLNDIGTYAAAQTDILSTPSIVMKKGDVPFYHGYFNQMKQEFVSARWMFYDGTHDSGNHYSDNNVLMFDTLDHPVYGLAMEKVKLSFRMAYALFDKIAFFLNRYLDLAIEDRKVNFRTSWYQSGQKIKGLKTELANSQNWPLRGLFWLSKDLYEDEPGFKEALEPDARQIHAIRNQLEHQFLKLHDKQWNGSSAEAETDVSPEAFGLSMVVSDFIGKTLKILKMVRAALIYLSLTVHSEEIRRSEERAGGAEISVKELPILK